MARLHPGLKLIVAIIIATIIGITFDSVGWGIGSFFIAMFFFIWVWQWVFGSPFEAKIILTEELENLIDKLEQIGKCKNELPLHSRGWCNILGLYVQYREMRAVGRLEAGSNKYHSGIDASIDFSSGNLDWRVQKYSPGDWENLVDPTLQIALWLQIHRGVPENYVISFNEAIEQYQKEGNLKLPSLESN